jgi:hypothetical protein
MSDPEVPEQVWKMVQNHLKYTDEEMALFRENPRNEKVMRTWPDMKAKTIVFEVVESTGCNSQHTVGTRFYLSGDGNLLTRMAPTKVCAYLLPLLTQGVFGMQELWYAGVDPNKLCFKRGGCFDVGVKCGGWGHVVIESKVMDRAEADRLFASTD